MEKVASHINEMQKIYEDFGSVFEQLAAEQSRSCGRPAQISMGEFLVQTSALWTNPLPCLGRLRRAPELTLFGGHAHTHTHTRPHAHMQLMVSFRHTEVNMLPPSVQAGCGSGSAGQQQTEEVDSKFGSVVLCFILSRCVTLSNTIKLFRHCVYSYSVVLRPVVLLCCVVSGYVAVSCSAVL